MATDRQPRKRSNVSDAHKMSLPEGKAYGDCWHFRRCNLTFDQVAADVFCERRSNPPYMGTETHLPDTD